MAARDLVSKLLAAGLSAGVFLIWWPEHHAGTDLASLVVRGALWTLTFELLLLAFAPLERLVRRAIKERIAVRRRLELEVRIGGACVLACAGAALPVALLAGAHAPHPAHAAALRPKPQRVVVVKRQKVVVRREVVTVPITSAAAEHPAPVSPVVVVRRPAAPPAKQAKRPATKTATPTKPAATPTKTTATAAPAPTGTSQPTTTAPPPAAGAATP